MSSVVLLLRLSMLLIQSSVACCVLLRPPAVGRSSITVQMNIGEQFMRSMSQMTDQRVARVSTIVIPFNTEKTLDEAYACFEAWKEEIGGDEAKFAEVARRESEDPASAPNGGDLGYVTRARQLPPQLDDVVFRDQKPGEEQPGVCALPFKRLHVPALRQTHRNAVVDSLPMRASRWSSRDDQRLGADLPALLWRAQEQGQNAMGVEHRWNYTDLKSSKLCVNG